MTDRMPTGDLRERLREALRQAAHWCDGRCDCEFGDHKVFVVAQVDGRITEIEGTPDALADAVLPVVEDETAALHQRAEEAEELLRELLDIRPCDMRGRWCQAHLEKAPCPQGEAQRYLAALDQPEETR